MIPLRQLFLQHVGQTSDFPIQLEITHARGSFLFDSKGKFYIDLISGVSVSNIGHCNPKVVEAVKNQVEKYMHLMVYGEYIQSPQVMFAKQLADLLPASLNSVYFVNSGSEANEAALKLAKRYTGRHEIIAFKKAYHGSTHGALSIMGDESFKSSFRPLLPGVNFLEFNLISDLDRITEKTACVIVEPIQAEAGVIVPNNNYLQKLRERCTNKGVVLIFDEVQTGFGRTGELFAFQKYNVIPDIFTIAKGMGGGMPIGALVASKEMMDSFKTNPVLGHITTFGGHPVSAAAALASLNVLINEPIISQVNEKSNLFKSLLKSKHIKEIRGHGLLLAVQLDNFENIQKVIANALENGVVLDWFLFCDSSFRIAPPLTINNDEITKACEIINQAINKVYKL